MSDKVAQGATGNSLPRSCKEVFKYGTEYYENLLEMYAGSMEKISAVRWGFIAEVEPEIVLDYGSGNNAFSLFKPDHVIIDSYDIGTIGSAPYPQTGMRHDSYDLICLWDVMEHVDWILESDANMLKWIAKSETLAATIPVLPEGAELEEWKHYKPGEHLIYFSVETFIRFVNELGFSLVKNGQPECPPRSDIYSFLFKRTT